MGQLDGLKGQIQALQEQYSKLGEWFAMEDKASKTMTTDIFFGVWDKFLLDMKQSWTKLQEQEAKEAARLRKSASSAMSQRIPAKRGSAQEGEGSADGRRSSSAPGSQASSDAPGSARRRLFNSRPRQLSSSDTAGDMASPGVLQRRPPASPMAQAAVGSRAASSNPATPFESPAGSPADSPVPASRLPAPSARFRSLSIASGSRPGSPAPAEGEAQADSLDASGRAGKGPGPEGPGLAQPSEGPQGSPAAAGRPPVIPASPALTSSYDLTCALLRGARPSPDASTAGVEVGEVPEPDPAPQAKGPGPPGKGKGPLPALPTKGPGPAPPSKGTGQAAPTKGPGLSPPTKGPGPAQPTKGPGPAPPTKGPGAAPPTKGPGPAQPTKEPGAAPPTKGPGAAPPTKGPGPAPPTKGPGPGNDAMIYDVLM